MVRYRKTHNKNIWTRRGLEIVSDFVELQRLELRVLAQYAPAEVLAEMHLEKLVDENASKLRMKPVKPPTSH